MEQRFRTSYYSSDWFQKRPNKVKQLLLAFPQTKFYQYRESGRPVRVLGVDEVVLTDEDKIKADSKYIDGNREYRLHCCSAHFGFINDVIGGVNPDDIEEVGQFDEYQLSIIAACGDPVAFISSMGWIRMVPDDLVDYD
jgi:hypothetical protein